jgi:hypothetical protein
MPELSRERIAGLTEMLLELRDPADLDDANRRKLGQSRRGRGSRNSWRNRNARPSTRPMADLSDMFIIPTRQEREAVRQ